MISLSFSRAPCCQQTASVDSIRQWAIHGCRWGWQTEMLRRDLRPLDEWESAAREKREAAFNTTLLFPLFSALLSSLLSSPRKIASSPPLSFSPSDSPLNVMSSNSSWAHLFFKSTQIKKKKKERIFALETSFSPRCLTYFSGRTTDVEINKIEMILLLKF